MHHPHHQSPLRHHPASMAGGVSHHPHGVHHPYDTMVGPPTHSVADYDPANISISTANMLMGGSASVSAQHAAAAASFSMNNNHHVLGSYSAASYHTYAQVHFTNYSRIFKKNDMTGVQNYTNPFVRYKSTYYF